MNLSPFVEEIVKLVVNEPEAVHVEKHRDRDGDLYEVRVAPNDVGKIIGKGGRVVSCVRYLVSAAAAKGRHRAFVKVITD